MKKSALIIIICLISVLTNAQNKSAYTWIVGNNASFGKFDGTADKPQTGSFYTTSAPNYPYIFDGGHSVICDSTTGKLLIICNGMLLFDTLGNIIENGDSLVPNSIYTQNSYPSESSTQASLILPKANSGEYYVFVTTASDSMHATWFVPNATRTPFDLLLYNVVDMNANGGMGKVIKKNIPLITHAEMGRTNMQACRHANGVDWWLLKKSGYETNEITRFLITKDSIYGPFKQNFAEPDFGICDAFGQSCFSKDGKKYASVQCKGRQLFMADFDRCSGELKNTKLFNIPIDSSNTNGQYESNYGLDSASLGCGFSPNGQFFYISKLFNIYQFEYKISDSSQAWYHVKYGMDTSFLAFEYYKSLHLGGDGRMYIGKVGGGFKQFSVIDFPDLKGAACGFCRKCFRVDNALGGLNTPPNVPDFNLGTDVSMLPCAPLAIHQFGNLEMSQLEIYPNPSSSIFYIKNRKGKKKVMFNSVGQIVLSTKEDEIDVSKLAKGMYYLRCNNEVKKVVIE
jgi:hypothetical protein